MCRWCVCWSKNDMCISICLLWFWWGRAILMRRTHSRHNIYSACLYYPCRRPANYTRPPSFNFTSFLNYWIIQLLKFNFSKNSWNSLPFTYYYYYVVKCGSVKLQRAIFFASHEYVLFDAAVCLQFSLCKQTAINKFTIVCKLVYNKTGDCLWN